MANIVCPCLQNADFLHEVMRFSRDENIRFLFILILDFYLLGASRDGAVVRAIACHQCDPGSLYCAPSGVSQGNPVFSSPQKSTSDLILFV